MKNLSMFCLIKKMMSHKTKRIQSKIHRIGTYDVFKNFCLVLMIKDIY